MLASKTASEENRTSTLVIGAGVSGLACANYLKSHGHTVKVLEARNRIGGRLATIKSPSGDVFDMGASWIHGINGNPIYELACRHHIKTVTLNYDKLALFNADGTPFLSDSAKLFESYVNEIEALLARRPELSALSAIDGIIRQLAKKDVQILLWRPMLLAFFERFANDPFATSLLELSSQYLSFEGYYEGDEVIFPEGYGQIAERLAEGLDIRLGVDVIEVCYDDTGVTVMDDDGRHYKADQVVITAPLGVLKRQGIDFVPDLPSLQQQAIDEIGFGVFNKVFFELETPLTTLEALQVGHNAFFYIDGQWLDVLNLSNVHGKPVYLVLFGGVIGEWLDTASDEQAWQLVYGKLKGVFKELPSTPKALHVSRWGADRYSYGAFSFPASAHRVQLIQALEDGVDGRVFFAGEHCSERFAGTVHGAYQTGLDVAKKILGENPPQS